MKRVMSAWLAIVFSVILCACGNPAYSEPEATEDVPEHGYASMDEAIDAYIQSRSSAVSLEDIKRMYPERVWNDPEGMQQIWEGSIEEGYAAYKNGMESYLVYCKEEYGEDFCITWEVTEVENFTEAGPYTEEDNQSAQEQFGVDAKDVEHYAITLTRTVKGSKGELIDPEMYCYPIKAGDTWYVY